VTPPAPDSANGERVLVVLAHPDDPEFYCGGTVARWVAEGREVCYCLLTRGDKGADESNVDPAEMARTREAEQRAAARVLGVREVVFLDHPDGYLVPDLGLRKEVTGIVRRFKPAIVVTCDPTNFFPNSSYINHPDHRAAGQATLDAVFPAAGSGMFFPELEQKEGLRPHKIRQVYVAGAVHPNTAVDVTNYIDRKIAALREHKSQIREPEGLEDRIRQWLLDSNSPPDAPRYVERFQRIDLG
jgi:LmbE family N-acetylglucosaminyl deacetylase